MRLHSAPDRSGPPPENPCGLGCASGASRGRVFDLWRTDRWPAREPDADRCCHLSPGSRMRPRPEMSLIDPSDSLERQNEKLLKIADRLMHRVEYGTAHSG